MKFILIVALLWSAFFTSVQASSFSGSVNIGNIVEQGKTVDIANLKAHTVIVKLRETKDGVTLTYTGAGIVIDKRHFLSVNHVTHEQDNAAGDNYYFAKEGDLAWYAKAVKTDPLHDLALFEIDKNAPDLPDGVVFSNAIQDETVIAVGHPNTDYNLSTGSIDWFHAKGLNNIDCTGLNISIQPGYSGGGVFAYDGSVVGMSFSASTQIKDLGYMITSQDIQNFLKE